MLNDGTRVDTITLLFPVLMEKSQVYCAEMLVVPLKEGRLLYVLDITSVQWRFCK